MLYAIWTFNDNALWSTQKMKDFNDASDTLARTTDF